MAGKAMSLVLVALAWAGCVKNVPSAPPVPEFDGVDPRAVRLLCPGIDGTNGESREVAMAVERILQGEECRASDEEVASAKAELIALRDVLVEDAIEDFDGIGMGLGSLGRNIDDDYEEAEIRAMGVAARMNALQQQLYNVGIDVERVDGRVHFRLSRLALSDTSVATKLRTDKVRAALAELEEQHDCDCGVNVAQYAAEGCEFPDYPTARLIRGAANRTPDPLVWPLAQYQMAGSGGDLHDYVRYLKGVAFSVCDDLRDILKQLRGE